MSLDFNNEDRQQSGFDLIPNGTIAPVVMTIRPGGAGEGGWLTQSNSSDAQYLNCEFTVESGTYARRKLWQNVMLSGDKRDEHGESIAARISRALLRAILESARGIAPDDMSEQAVSARRVSGWGDFNGLTFWARIGIEKDKTGSYGDRNRIAVAITPDMKDYGHLSEGNPAPAAAQTAAPWGTTAQAQPAATVTPAWAAAAPAPQASASGSPIPAWGR